MDVIPMATAGSSSTQYCDYYNVSDSNSRMLYRGSQNANADGGVSCANASNDASHSYAIIGSRLAFRGKIVVAESVAAYKAAVEVA